MGYHLRRGAWGDVLIAATAQSLRLIVATRNVQDFEGLDVEIINPFDFKAKPRK